VKHVENLRTTSHGASCRDSPAGRALGKGELADAERKERRVALGRIEPSLVDLGKELEERALARAQVSG